jgi:CcmD family protein
MTFLSNKNLLVLLAVLLFHTGVFAQTADTNPPVEMADGLYQSGKIYVVITAIALIFVGIIVYLVLLDRKIGKLEKELKKD